MADIESLSETIRQLYAIIDELDAECREHKRHFTLDGHLLGSIGEVYAAERYGIELYTSSKKAHDGWKIGPGGERRDVQIKVTQERAKRKVVPISHKPDFLVVLVVHNDGSFEEAFNGWGDAAWNLVKDKPRPTNGQYQVPLNKLRELNEGICEEDRV